MWCVKRASLPGSIFIMTRHTGTKPRATFFSARPSLAFLWLKSPVLHLPLSFSCSVIKCKLFWNEWHHRYAWCNDPNKSRKKQSLEFYCYLNIEWKVLLFYLCCEILRSQYFQIFFSERPKYQFGKQKPPEPKIR